MLISLCFPPASCIAGGEPHICRTGAGQTQARAPGLVQNGPHAHQSRHRLRSDPLPGKTAVNVEARRCRSYWRTVFMSYGVAFAWPFIRLMRFLCFFGTVLFQRSSFRFYNSVVLFVGMVSLSARCLEECFHC